MDYTTITGDSVGALTAAMTRLATIAASETAMKGRLEEAVQMWQHAADELTDTALVFAGASREVRASWAGRHDAPLFDQAVAASSSSMATSAGRMGNSTAGPNGGSGPWQALQAAADQITSTQHEVEQRRIEFNALITEFNAVTLNLQDPTVPGATGTEALMEVLRPIVHAAGVSLNTLATAYTAATTAVQRSGEGHQWVGPRSDSVTPVGAPPGFGPSARGAAPGAPGSALGGATGPTGLGDALSGADVAPGLGEGATLDAAISPSSESGDPGTTSGGGEPASATAGTSLAGTSTTGAGTAGIGTAGTGTPPSSGTGLAGVGTLPTAGSAIRPGTSTVGLPGQPRTALPYRPPAALPLVPLPGADSGAGRGSSRPLPPVATPSSSAGRFSPLPLSTAGGGGGNGLIGAGGPGDARTVRPGSPVEMDQPIAQAARPAAATPPTTVGAQQAAVSGTTSAAQPSGPAGSGMPPPMMPPTALAGGGGGGRSGAATLRPGGPGRSRVTGSTPGVPAGLRGRAGNTDAAGAFPARPPATSKSRHRQQQDEVDTLQLLDEELWAVQGGTADSTKPSVTSAPAVRDERRLAR